MTVYLRSASQTGRGVSCHNANWAPLICTAQVGPCRHRNSVWPDNRSSQPAQVGRQTSDALSGWLARSLDGQAHPLEPLFQLRMGSAGLGWLAYLEDSSSEPNYLTLVHGRLCGRLIATADGSRLRLGLNLKGRRKENARLLCERPYLSSSIQVDRSVLNSS